MSYTTVPTTVPNTTTTVFLNTKQLAPGTVFDYIVKATNTKGNVVSSSSAQFKTKGYRLRIKVTSTSGTAISYTDVTIHSDPQTAKTDKDGYVTFEDVAPGQHSVEVGNGSTKITQSVVVEDSRQSSSTVPTTPEALAEITKQESATLEAQTYKLSVPITVAFAGAKPATKLLPLLLIPVAVIAFIIILKAKRRSSLVTMTTSDPAEPKDPTSDNTSAKTAKVPDSPSLEETLNALHTIMPKPSTVINPKKQNTANKNDSTSENSKKL
jgi:hypothetical protein